MARGRWRSRAGWRSSPTISDKLFKTEGRKVNDLRDAYIASAGGLGASTRRRTRRAPRSTGLLNAKTVKDYEAAVASLNTKLEKTAKIQGELAGLQKTLADRQVMDWQKAEEVIAKYGGVGRDLGQQFVAGEVVCLVEAGHRRLRDARGHGRGRRRRARRDVG